jgi:hypothetical protein
MNLAQLTAQAKLEALDKEFASLINDKYVAPITSDVVTDEAGDVVSKTTSAEYEFSDAYTNPERAIAIIIERMQLRSEVAGLPRTKIILTVDAAKMIAGPRKNRKPLYFEIKPVIAEAQTPLVVPQETVRHVSLTKETTPDQSQDPTPSC